MGTHTSPTTTGSPTDGGSLGRRWAVALAVAVLVNAVIVLAAELAGLAPEFAPLALWPVVFVTAGGVLAAAGAYAALARTSERPARAFAVVAAVVLCLSLVPNALVAPTLPGATTPGVLVLALLHVTTAAVCLAVLPAPFERD
ncbi:MAG: DUF6069 family protein [Haloarculaceae archaeon]